MIEKWPQTEVELAKAFVWWLRDLKWDVYQEVQIARQDSVADIVAVQGSLVWIVEVKRSFGWSVLEQAAGWNQYAHFRSVGVPEARMRYPYCQTAILKAHGIGVLTANRWNDGSYHVREDRKPRFDRKPRLAGYMRDGLREEQKTWANAGSANGNHYTPFKATCRAIADYVGQHPGCTMKEMLADVSTHYATPASARCALTKWIGNGMVKGVEGRKEKGKWLLFPEEQTA